MFDRSQEEPKAMGAAKQREKPELFNKKDRKF
jgi:hypothetical protein